MGTSKKLKKLEHLTDLFSFVVGLVGFKGKLLAGNLRTGLPGFGALLSWRSGFGSSNALKQVPVSQRHAESAAQPPASRQGRFLFCCEGDRQLV